jgi:hypothetical protein
MPILSILCHNGSFVTWKVVSFTTAKFKPLILSGLGLSKSKLRYDRRSVGQSVLVSSTHLGLTTRFLLLSDSCEFVDVGRSLWRENGSAVYNCYWSSPLQSFLGPSPTGLVTIFTVSDSILQPGGPGPRIYIPQEQGDPVTHPGTEFPSIASYDSQGYGGGIRTRLLAGSILPLVPVILIRANLIENTASTFFFCFVRMLLRKPAVTYCLPAVA